MGLDGKLRKLVTLVVDVSEKLSQWYKRSIDIL